METIKNSQYEQMAWKNFHAKSDLRLHIMRLAFIEVDLKL